MATPNSISSRGIQCVVGTIGKKPPPGAGAAQCGNGDVGVVGGEGVVEGSARKTHAEWRTALRLSVEQAGEEHRFRCRLSPPDRLARTDQPGKIERFGRYGDRSFSRAAQRRHLRRGRNSRRVIRSLVRSPRTQPAPRRSPRVSGKARSAPRTAPATRSLRAERRKGRRRRAPPSPGRALRRSANEATPGSLYSSIFWKFSSSSLAYSAKFSWIRRRRREIFGNGSNFDQE